MTCALQRQARRPGDADLRILHENMPVHSLCKAAINVWVYGRKLPVHVDRDSRAVVERARECSHDASVLKSRWETTRVGTKEGTGITDQELPDNLLNLTFAKPVELC